MKAAPIKLMTKGIKNQVSDLGQGRAIDGSRQQGRENEVEQNSQENQQGCFADSKSSDHGFKLIDFSEQVKKHLTWEKIQACG